MMTHKLKKLPKNTSEVEVKIPWNTIQEEYKKAFDSLLSQFEMKGYRKGKVPRELAEKNIQKEVVYQQLMKAYLPSVYEELLKKEDLKPVISPRIDLKQAKENEDWEIIFTIAEKPLVELKNYKEAAKKAKNDSKKADIWVPSKDSEEKPKEDPQKALNSVLDAVLKEATVEVSDLIIEEELNQKLSRLVDDIQRLGLTTDTYLKSRNTTMDALREQYKKEIEEMYKVEFILMKIADEEKISVEQKDLDALFTTIKDDKEKAAAQQNAYFYATILRKQKTLDYLTSL